MQLAHAVADPKAFRPDARHGARGHSPTNMVLVDFHLSGVSFGPTDHRHFKLDELPHFLEECGSLVKL